MSSGFWRCQVNVESIDWQEKFLFPLLAQSTFSQLISQEIQLRADDLIIIILDHDNIRIIHIVFLNIW